MITGAAGRSVRLFDVLGRQIATIPSAMTADPQTIVTPASGVYLLQIDGIPDKKEITMAR